VKSTALKQRFFPWKKRTYFALCFLSLFAPAVFAMINILFFQGDPYSHEGMKLAWVTLAGFMLLTYPLGVIPTLASFFIAIYLGWMTPFGSVIFLSPLYFVAGYFQWYVFIPRYANSRRRV
jgi:hypothetical protein